MFLILRQGKGKAKPICSEYRRKMVCQFHQRSFTKNWQNVFSWTKSHSLSEHNEISHVFLSSYAAKKTIMMLAIVVAKSRKLSVRRIMKRDLRLNVFRRKKAQLLLSDADCPKRVKCCKTLLRRRCLVLWQEDIHGPTTNQHPKWLRVCCSK